MTAERITRETLPATVDCGHAPQPTFYTAGTRIQCGNEYVTMTGDEIMFPGYAHTADGRRICPGCADSEQAAEMAATVAGVPFHAYTSTDGRTITTWSGGVLARVTSRTDNGHQTYLRAVDSDGRHWSGRGPSGTGMCVSLRRAAVR